MAEHKPEILWSLEALDDIDRLWDYYVHAAGRVTADNVLREVAKAIAVIDDFPLAGRARHEIRAGLRSLAVAPQNSLLPIEG